MGVVFEVSGALPITSGALYNFKETTATVTTMYATSVKALSLIVGYSGTVSTNTAPTSVTNVTTSSTVTGTTTNASPRQVTPFSAAINQSAISIVSTYAASSIQYGAAYVLTPA